MQFRIAARQEDRVRAHVRTLAGQRREPAAPAHYDAFHRAVAGFFLRPRLVAAESGTVLTWAADEDPLDGLLAPILRSVAEVLSASEGRPVVRRCAGEGCELFFVDRSPTGQRRWCAMKYCGNRAKTRSHYHRVGKAERRQLRKDAIPKPGKGS